MTRRLRRSLENEIADLGDEVGADEENVSLVKAIQNVYAEEQAERAEDAEDGEDTEDAEDEVDET
ncbi:hypothetical protein [Halopelagius fulvigenes]|uniref:Uncharacterized protein n=1 Tax=Halopelagius fulvigenes TaxID=1198324 RepID=A0ABD5TY88_9EURY